MNCKKANYWIHEFLDSELSPGKIKKLEMHLKICTSCQDEFNTLKSTVSLLNQSRFSHEGASISLLAQALYDKKAFTSRTAGWKLAAACAIIAILGIFISQRSIQQTKYNTVKKGLDYLAGAQNEDGSWDANYFKKSSAVTSLALLSFIESNPVIDNNQYSKVILKAINFLLTTANSNGLLANSTEGSVSMYAHGFGILALSKVYQITGREDIKQILEKAVRLSKSSQNKRGGWRYQPIPFDDDISVTACQTLALVKANESGIFVDNKTAQKGLLYVKSCVTPDGKFNYIPDKNINSQDSFPRTSAGISVLSSSYGIYSNEIQKGVSYLEKVSLKDQYNSPYFYYGLQFLAYCFNDIKNLKILKQKENIRELLFAKQNKNGSWSSKIGDNYATAAATFVLQRIKRS